jgi:hypothetical protein
MSWNHFANLLSHRSVKDSFNRKLTTIVLKRNKASQSEQFCLDASQGDPSSFHLVNLLSYRDVKKSLS